LAQTSSNQGTYPITVGHSFGLIIVAFLMRISNSFLFKVSEMIRSIFIGSEITSLMLILENSKISSIILGTFNPELKICVAQSAFALPSFMSFTKSSLNQIILLMGFLRLWATVCENAFKSSIH
jgi:hypothetical protein